MINKKNNHSDPDAVEKWEGYSMPKSLPPDSIDPRLDKYMYHIDAKPSQTHYFGPRIPKFNHGTGVYSTPKLPSLSDLMRMNLRDQKIGKNKSNSFSVEEEESKFHDDVFFPNSEKDAFWNREFVDNQYPEDTPPDMSSQHQEPIRNEEPLKIASPKKWLLHKYMKSTHDTVAKPQPEFVEITRAGNIEIHIPPSSRDCDSIQKTSYDDWGSKEDKEKKRHSFPKRNCVVHETFLPDTMLKKRRRIDPNHEVFHMENKNGVPHHFPDAAASSDPHHPNNFEYKNWDTADYHAFKKETMDRWGTSDPFFSKMGNKMEETNTKKKKKHTYEESFSSKVMDTSKGTTCHQCKQKTTDPKSVCCVCSAKGGSVIRGSFCASCLKNRYGEDLDDVLSNSSWVCPICRGECNCSSCRRKLGKTPISVTTREALKKGFVNVRDYLASIGSV